MPGIILEFYTQCWFAIISRNTSRERWKTLEKRADKRIQELVGFWGPCWPMLGEVGSLFASGVIFHVWFRGHIPQE